MRNVVIYGASYLDTLKLIENTTDISVIGFIDDSLFGSSHEVMGFPILGNGSLINQCVEKGCFFVNNVFSTTAKREMVYLKLKEKGAKITSLVHSNVDTSFAEIGEGVWLHDGVKIGTNARLGNNVAVRFNSIVNHDNTLADHVFIGPGVTLSGRVFIGKGAFLGSGSVVLPDVKIGENSVVGSGSVVTKDVPKNVVVAGNPARILTKTVGQLPTRP